MFWMVDDDGTAMFRFGTPGHGPAAARSVDKIIMDMADQEIGTVTNAVFIRKRRTGGEEVVWSGRIIDVARVSAARSYLERLAISAVGNN